MWGSGWGYWGWGWWFWAFWAVILFVVIWLLAGAFAGDGHEVSAEEQILRERYARGEITQEEFRRRMDELRRAA